jgi:hypothetical protein
MRDNTPNNTGNIREAGNPSTSRLSTAHGSIQPPRHDLHPQKVAQLVEKTAAHVVKH